MARAAYRKGSQGTGLWVISCVLGVVGMHAVIFWMIATNLEKKIGFWVLVIAFAPLIGGIALGWILSARVNRKRIDAMGARLAQLGFETNTKPSKPECETFAATIIHLFPSHTLQNGAAGIRWFAIEHATNTKVLLFEHEYVTGSGRTSQTHHHTMIAWPAGHPDLGAAAPLANAPWLFLGRFSRFVRRANRDREMKSPEFADLSPVWSLVGDAGTAGQFLNAGVRRALESSPKNEVWSLGAGWVCCVFAGPLDAANVESFLKHGRGLLAAVGRS